MKDIIKNLINNLNNGKEVLIHVDDKEIIGEVLLMCLSPKILVTFDSDGRGNWIRLECAK